MEGRPATRDDIPAIAELQRRWDIAWLGGPETGDDEVGEMFALAEHSRVVVQDGRIVAAGWFGHTDSILVIDPAVAAVPIYADLLPWFAGRHPGTTVHALDRDDVLRAALVGHGWRHVHSAFDLVRAITPDWVIAEPSWPTGIAVRDFDDADSIAVHRLIYVDAGWAEVTGHHDRGFEEWRAIFVTKYTLPEQQVLAWRGDRLVGIAMGRTFSDGTGWVAQLAVAKDQRGLGLGRALLLEALRRRRNSGATSVGLSVNEANQGALALYLGVGLQIKREWMAYEQP